MKFGEAIKSGFSKYITFSGRAPRSEYWFWTLFVILASIVTGVIDAAAFGDPQMRPFSGIVSLALVLPGIAVAVRRLHDVDHSGWWLLLYFTGIGALLLLFWAVQPSQTEENEYGPNPLATT